MVRYYPPVSNDIWQYAMLWVVDNRTAFWNVAGKEERWAGPAHEAPASVLLDRAGRDGWELAAMGTMDTNSIRYVFKRRVES
jgi:hypothetical protein